MADDAIVGRELRLRQRSNATGHVRFFRADRVLKEVKNSALCAAGVLIAECEQSKDCSPNSGECPKEKS